jgi:hypothetical protein
MYLGDLHDRLVASLRSRLRNGELSERRLALITGISQPHMHNVLKGVRFLSTRACDQILRALRMSAADLMGTQEVATGNPQRGFGEIPVLADWLGPGLPLPIGLTGPDSQSFPLSFISSLERPSLVRLAPDPHMSGRIRENDLVLLDSARSKRLHIEADALYVVNRDGEGLVRELEPAGLGWLRLLARSSRGEEFSELLSLKGRHALDVVKARVVWLGRYF